MQVNNKIHWAQYNFNFIVTRRNVIPFYARQHKTIQSSNSLWLIAVQSLLKKDFIKSFVLKQYLGILTASSLYSGWTSSFNSILVQKCKQTNK